jgi:hypothetical protein
MKRILSISLVALTLGLFGCHPNDQSPPSISTPTGKPPAASTPPAPTNRFAGAWTLDKTAMQAMANQQKERRASPIDSIEGSLDIKENNEWTMTITLEGKSHIGQGVATVTNSRISFVAATVDGKSSKSDSEQKPIILVLSDDGRKLTGQGKEGAGMVFNKQ